MTARKEVYAAIDTERAYQDRMWAGTASSRNPGHDKNAQQRTLDEFALYIKGYADDLARIASHSDDPAEKLNFVRKVAGLAVACMEAHGAPPRVS